MNKDILEVEIEEVRGDIESLNREIDILDKEYSELLAQAQDLEEALRDADGKSNQQETDGHSKANYDIDGPPIIINNCFDESIRKYFKNMQDGPEITEDDLQITKRQRLEGVASEFKAKCETIVEMKQNILYENIFRFGGVTAFPINTFLFDDDSQIIGFRFDICSHYKQKFVTPHYVILRKVKNEEKGHETSMKWEVYRHTLPAYLPISEYSTCLDQKDEELAFLQFTQKIRGSLIQVQYRHDKFDSLRNIKVKHLTGGFTRRERPVIENLEKDLSCERVNITLVSSITGNKKPPTISIVCTDTYLKETACTMAGIGPDDKIILLCENLLKNCDLKNLTKTFKNVASHLLKSENV